MTQSRKRALFTLIIWGMVFIAFALAFFLGGGPKMFSEEKWRRAVSAIPIALGWIAYFWMLYLTRSGKGVSSSQRDERDEIIQKRANAAAFIMVLIYTYVFSLTLFEVYNESGQVPVGWMWFMSYSLMFVGFITAAISTLIIEIGMSKDAQS